MVRYSQAVINGAAGFVAFALVVLVLAYLRQAQLATDFLPSALLSIDIAFTTAFVAAALTIIAVLVGLAYYLAIFAKPAWRVRFCGLIGKNRWTVVAACVTVVLAAFMVVPPEHITIPSNDALDSTIPYHFILARQNLLALDPWLRIPTAYDGVSAAALGIPAFNAFLQLYRVLPGFWPLSFHLFLYFILTFIFAHLFVMQLLTALKLDGRFTAPTVALFFAFMPSIFPMLGTLLCLLILAYAVVRSLTAPTKIDVVFYALPPFFGAFVYGPFLVYPLLMASLGIYWWRTGDTKAKRTLLLTLFSFILFIALEYRLLLGVLFPYEVDHRSVWLQGRHFTLNNLFDPSRWIGFLKQLSEFVLAGNYEFSWNPNGLFIYNLVALGVLFTCGKILRWQNKLWPIGFVNRVQVYFFFSSMLGLLLVGAAVAFFQVSLIDLWSLIPVPIQYGRIASLGPVFAMSGIAVALAVVSNQYSRFKYFSSVVFLIVAFEAFSMSPLAVGKAANMAHYIRYGFQNAYVPSYTVGTVYQREVFHNIKLKLGPGWLNERVISVGMDPMIAALHGFRHLDGYFPSYSLNYKIRFRRIIAPELDVNPQMRAYFDGWGSRANIFVSSYRGSDVVLRIDVCSFVSLGGTLVLSSLKISNADQIGLQLHDSIDGVVLGLRPTIHLYRPTAGVTCPARSTGLGTSGHPTGS